MYWSAHAEKQWQNIPLFSVTKALCFCNSSRLCVHKETLSFANEGAFSLSQGDQAVSLGAACQDSVCSAQGACHGFRTRTAGKLQLIMATGCHKFCGFFIYLILNQFGCWAFINVYCFTHFHDPARIQSVTGYGVLSHSFRSYGLTDLRFLAFLCKQWHFLQMIFQRLKR